MFYAGASLPAPLWRELVTIAKRADGRDIPMTTSWGLTETAPSITMIIVLCWRQGTLESRCRALN
jgi:feruloyl-CoA synthase